MNITTIPHPNKQKDHFAFLCEIQTYNNESIPLLNNPKEFRRKFPKIQSHFHKSIITKFHGLSLPEMLDDIFQKLPESFLQVVDERGPNLDLDGIYVDWNDVRASLIRIGRYED